MATLRIIAMDSGQVGPSEWATWHHTYDIDIDNDLAGVLKGYCSLNVELRDVPEHSKAEGGKDDIPF